MYSKLKNVLFLTETKKKLDFYFENTKFVSKKRKLFNEMWVCCSFARKTILVRGQFIQEYSRVVTRDNMISLDPVFSATAFDPRSQDFSKFWSPIPRFFEFRSLIPQFLKFWSLIPWQCYDRYDPEYRCIHISQNSFTQPKAIKTYFERIYTAHIYESQF